MNSMQYFEDTFLEIRQEESVAVMEWLGLAKTHDYRLGHEKFLELLQSQETPSGYWLFDYQAGKVIDVKDQNWTTDEWYQSVLEIPNFELKKIGVVMSMDIFNKVAVRIIITKIEQQSDSEVAYFENQEDALDWLMMPAETDELVEVES